MGAAVTRVLEGTLGPADKAASDYRLLPFTVPAGTTRIDVHYEYSQAMSAADTAGQGNVLDIGLFDPRGGRFTGRGFRGWSGSARSSFFVSLPQATPGYLPGPIQAGKWRVLLGLYRIAAQGCRYRVVVTLTRGEAGGAGGGRRMAAPPAPLSPPAPRWYRGDLHCHSHHSDASGSLADLAAAARSRGLDFLALTDHNTVSQNLQMAPEAGPDLLLIPGEEITTYYGHANLWGLREWVDFRCREAGTMNRIVARAHRQGALFSVNHPKEGGPAWEYEGVTGFDCVEVWQGPWELSNHQSLAWWDGLLQQGRRVAAVGGSDKHQPPWPEQASSHRLGNPTTWVYAERLSSADVLRGIREGRAFISSDVDGPRLQLTAMVEGRPEASMGEVLTVSPGMSLSLRCRVQRARGDVLRHITGGQVQGRAEVEAEDFSQEWILTVSSQSYFRAEVVQASEASGTNPAVAPSAPVLKALTNPIYLRLKA